LVYQYSDDFFRAIVQNSSDLISIFDENRTFKYVSPSMESILGYGPEELLGRPVFDFIHRGDVRAAGAAIIQLGTTRKQKLSHIRFRSKEGGWKWLEITATNMLGDPTIKGVVCNSKDITEMVMVEKKERESQAYFSALFHNSPCAICTIGMDGIVNTTNGKVESVLGIRDESILGRPISDLFIEDCHIHKAIEDVRAGDGSEFESRFCKESGEVADVAVRVIPVGEEQMIGGHVLIEDISARKSDLKQLEMLSLVASKTTNGVTITDAEDRIEWVNAAFTRVTGYPLSKVIGTTPASFLQGPDTSEAAALRIQNNRKAKVSFAEEILNYTINGSPIWFLIEVTPLLDPEGNLMRTITILTDITEKKKTEQEMFKLTQNLSRQNQDLQQFTYMVSHNLRSPIANCKGLLELLACIDKADPFFDDSMEMLQSSVVHLEQITADMNSILTFRDKNSQATAEMINLRSFLKDSVKDFQDFRSCSLTQINNRVSAEISVKGNRGFLHNIFTNLISNSIKYRSDERNLQIDLDAWQSDGMVYITLQDNGLGFDSGKLKNQLFKLYKRFHTDREEGRGIGLYLVKTAVEAMNGKIDVESSPGMGTKFMISIPATS
jgi:PAS domain S-box-containing protein